MQKFFFTRGLLVLFILLENIGIRNASASAPEPEIENNASWETSSVSTYSEMSVELSTPTHQVIKFNTPEKSPPIEKPAQEAREIPHLVLKRNGILTPSYERTIEIVVNNVPVFTPGIYVVLTISTQHNDPDLQEKDSKRFQIRREEQFIPHTVSTQQGVRLKFSVTFDRITMLDDKPILTPTDYFQYEISIYDMSGNLRQRHMEDYAFLMENQWRVPLPKLLEAEPGAAPGHLLIYYYDMIPYQSDMRNPDSKIHRQDVGRFIQVDLIPAMVQAIQTQSNDWGFMWYPEWRSFRWDNDPKTLSVALGEHGIWFHGEAPSLGHSMISIRVDGSAGEYDNLTDGIMSIFHHELFHNLQRNISLHFSGNGNVSGKDEAWKMFSEGTAVLASSVGQPKIQFEQSSPLRSYMMRANSFIGSEGIFAGALNKSYSRIPYHTALYWRYLYEQCGGMTEKGEDPAAGMNVIRSILEALYKGDLLDIYLSEDSVESLPMIMDSVLVNSTDCPFQSYEESLIQFSEAIYMLKYRNEPCLSTIAEQKCGFNDPTNIYTSPPVESKYLDNKRTSYFSGGIPSSYGIDFSEVEMTNDVNGKSVTIVFDRASNSNSEFAVEVVKLKATGKPEALGLLTTKTGQNAIDINSINTKEFGSIGLIIVRTDSMEKLDSLGNYTIRVMVN